MEYVVKGKRVVVYVEDDADIVGVLGVLVAHGVRSRESVGKRVRSRSVEQPIEQESQSSKDERLLEQVREFVSTLEDGRFIPTVDLVQEWNAWSGRKDNTIGKIGAFWKKTGDLQPDRIYLSGVGRKRGFTVVRKQEHAE